MQALIADTLWQQADILRMRSGSAVTVRPADSDDADALQAYFRGLSAQSRYSRLMGAVSEISRAELDKFTHASFTPVAPPVFHWSLRCGATTVLRSSSAKPVTC